MTMMMMTVMMITATPTTVMMMMMIMMRRGRKRIGARFCLITIILIHLLPLLPLLPRKTKVPTPWMSTRTRHDMIDERERGIIFFSNWLPIKHSSIRHYVVPQKHKQDPYWLLGGWISRQRKRYKEKLLLTDRIELLESIGFV